MVIVLFCKCILSFGINALEGEKLICFYLLLKVDFINENEIILNKKLETDARLVITLEDLYK